MNDDQNDQLTETEMDKVIKNMEANLLELDKVIKVLEKESVGCKNACAGLKSTIREIDGAIRGK